MLLSTQLFAQTQDSKSNQINSVKSKTNLKTAKVYQSRENRNDKKYVITVGAIGYNFGTGTNNYEVGYHYKQNRIIGLQYQEFRNSLPIFSSTRDEDESDYERNRKGHALLLSYKAFAKNSLYLKSSLYHRIQERVDKNSSAQRDQREFNKLSYEDMGLLFSIGNQWQWKNFTLGADWIGMSTVLAIINQEGDYKIEGRDLADWTLLNFYMGYSF
jgi:hypothetical protein